MKQMNYLKKFIVLIVIFLLVGCASSTRLFSKIGYDNMQLPSRIEYSVNENYKLITQQEDIRSCIDALENIRVKSKTTMPKEGKDILFRLVLPKGGQTIFHFIDGKLIINEEAYNVENYEQLIEKAEDIIR